MILEKVYDELYGMIEDLQKKVGKGGSQVTITPTLESGTKVADYTIGSDEGSLYAPTPVFPPVGVTIDRVQITLDSAVSSGGSVKIGEYDITGKIVEAIYGGIIESGYCYGLPYVASSGGTGIQIKSNGDIELANISGSTWAQGDIVTLYIAYTAATEEKKTTKKK